MAQAIKNLPAVGDPGSILGLGRSTGGYHVNPLEDYSCLEDPMDRRAWWAIDQGVTKSQTHYMYVYKTESFCCMPEVK